MVNSDPVHIFLYWVVNGLRGCHVTSYLATWENGTKYIGNCIPSDVPSVIHEMSVLTMH